jgi:hypothetical protein
MAQDPDLEHPPIPPEPPGRPDEADPAATATDPALDPQGIDKAYWLDCLADAERAEQNWRQRGREIVGIYRNEARASKRAVIGPGPVTFNILFANTEVMLPAVYQKPPEPVVRSRFTKVSMPPPMPPPMMPPMAPPPPMGAPPSNGVAAPPPPPAGAPPPAGPVPGVTNPAGTIGQPGPAGGMPPPPPVPGPAMPMAGPGIGMPPPPPPGTPPVPRQATIETAAAVVEKALDIVLEDEHSDSAIKMAIKDLLLPGRGVCRVRWRPQMKTIEMPGGPLPDGTTPTEERKVWEEVGDEYVYWEDLLVDPVRAAPDMNWIAFRHLFTRQELEREFAGSPEYDALVAANKLEEIFKWTDESAALSPVGGGSAMKTAEKLGGKIRKAMLWEIWDRMERRIIWLCRDATGIVFRVDPDVLQLQGFYPIPTPMLSITTTDSRIPRPYYDLYAKLADDLDETSARISRLTKQIKVRGAYNSASREIADILTADDNKMIGVEGVDMINGGLSNHIWIVPIVDFMNALDKLFLAREQTKQAIYEIMGISDIMRGATKASETATAQRIKGTMGVSRLEEAKSQAADFVLDLMRLKAEIICQNFDAETLSVMTGEEVTPEVMDILRSDFTRNCSIDIETDSTVEVDLQAEQQGMAMIMQSVQLVMQGTQQMLMTQILPPDQVLQLGLELLKMALHPVRYSRGVVSLIDDFQEQLAMAAALPPPPMQPPAPPLPQGGGPAAPQGGPPGGSTTPGGPPASSGLPNGAGGPPLDAVAPLAA